VPSSGMARVRAASTAARTPAELSYGLPGTIQIPSKPATSSGPATDVLCSQ